MLSHQSTNLPQGHHRRQQSIPTAFDDLKISSPVRHAAHHRPLSFDQSMWTRVSPEPEQQDQTTNTNQRQLQHIISETQQRPTARPGQQRHNSDDGTIRPSRFPTLPSTGCFKTELSEHQISNMTDEQIYELFTNKSNQDPQHSFGPALSAGSLDGNGPNANTVAGTTQGGGDTFETPGSVESSRRSSVQYSMILPKRPYTPPAQTNKCKMDLELDVLSMDQSLTPFKVPSQ